MESTQPLLPPQPLVQIPKIEYCLYARKSSEGDERQAMSIDSQIKEMSTMAVREGLFVKEIRQESHSAKLSGKRPIFNQILEDVRGGMFNGILSWAPDRLSRNAGDLGSIVDLMDQGGLVHIKTYTQAFSNNPNEKFLLMILCSQAKLENDNRSINVKRGIRTKCEMGWRPGKPPIGYYNRAMAGVKDIVVDPKRGYTITEMFRRVAKEGHSGRTIKRWMDVTGFTTRADAKLTLSMIYLMLKNPFYYGEFQYPVSSGIWYKGKHKPLITKVMFEKVQGQLTSIPKPWGVKKFDFKGLFKCATCGSSVVAEERFRKRKWDSPRHHIYYHCSRFAQYDCPERYMSDERLKKELVRYAQFVEMAQPQTIKITDKITRSMDTYRKVRDEVLLHQNVDPDDQPISFLEYSKYALINGAVQEKRDIVVAFNKQLYIRDRTIVSSKSY